MESAWLYYHLGTIAQIAGLAALILIGLLSLRRRHKRNKLARQQRHTLSNRKRD